MKMRNGFVSNSSSSSFIVAANSKSELEVSIKISLRPMIEHEINDENDLFYWVKNFCYYNTLEGAIADSPWMAEKIAKIRFALSEGKTVYVGTAKDHGDGGDEMGAYIRQKGLTKNVSSAVEVISDC